MPELPEVETMRRGIAAVIGQTIESVMFPRIDCRPMTVLPSRRSLSTRLKQRVIVTTDRRGKRVVLRLDNRDALVFEPRMTGIVMLADPPTQSHLRMVLNLNGNGAPQLFFWDRRGIGVLKLLREAELETELGTPNLGPDALQISAQELRLQLAQRKKEIKVALLDQKLIAGIGNLYASEVLFESGIDPRARCDRLSRRQWTRLADAIHRVLQAAIEYEGSTLSDGTYRNALNQSGGYQNAHQVYDRAGKSCPRCGSHIIRIVQAQRSTFYCGECQRKRDRRD